MDGRVPPYNADAETCVLGSVLLDNKCWGEIYAILNQDDFYVEANRRIFDSMLGLFSSGTPVDHVTLGHALRQAGDLEKVGGSIALSVLTDKVATTANVSHYSNIVRELSAIRKVIYAAQNVAVEGFGSNGIESITGNVDILIKVANNLARTRMPDNLLHMGDKVLENYKLVEMGYRGIELPWSSLDKMTAGLWPKTITMFVGRPGTGKTEIAVICGKHAWDKGKKVLIVSPEMSKDEIAERYFVVESKLDYHGLISGQLPTPQLEKLESTIEKFKKLDGIWIMDSDDDLTPRNIDAGIRACNPDLLVVDSIYDLKIKGDRRERALTALDWMRRTGKELGYATVGFAQQNRAAELSEKKGGGARLGTIALADEIAQDVHAVFALQQSKDDKADKIMKIIPLKIRRGQSKKSMIKICWDFENSNFDEIIDDDEKYEDEEVPF